MKKIGILGGSFNPIHKGHIEIIHSLLKDFDLDEVLLLISYEKENKDKQVVSPARRIRMIKLALEEEDLTSKVSVCNYEIKQKKFVQTYESLKFLKQKNIDCNLYFAFGSDHVPGIQKWKNSRYFQKYAKLICYERRNYPLLVENTDLLINLGSIVAPVAIPDVSSSELRHGKNLKLLNKSVLNYIVESRLYLDKWARNTINDKERFLHCKRVALKMSRLSKVHGLDKNEAYVAGLFHDVGKNWKKEDALTFLKERKNVSKLHVNIWHQYIAAFYLKDVLNIESKKAFSAISKHVTANKRMNVMDKLLYVVDKMDSEKFMNSLSSKEKKILKHVLVKDLNNAFLFVLNRNIVYLLSQKDKSLTREAKRMLKTRDHLLNIELKKGKS